MRVTLQDLVRDFPWPWRAARPGVAAPSAEEAGAAEAARAVRAVLEAVPTPILLLDADLKITAANGEARGRWAGALEGQRLSAVVRFPPLLDAAAACRQGAAARTLEYAPSGQVEEHFLCTVAGVEQRHGRDVLVVFQDRTGEIMAERTRVDFVANASHELRTPLAALTGLIETLAGHAKDSAEDRATFLAMMQVQAERMRRLIDDLLSLSRIELDENVPPSGRADLAAIAREAADACAPAAAARGARIEVIGAEGAEVIGDRFQLVQVAQNLIENALKYSSVGGLVRVDVAPPLARAQAEEAAGRRWAEADRHSLLTPPPAPARAYGVLRVEDAGPGVPRRYLPRLGERFFRVEREEGVDRGGTGLGLAIVKHIVNRHRGGLIVESRAGQGAAFGVYLEGVRPAAGGQEGG